MSIHAISTPFHVHSRRFTLFQRRFTLFHALHALQVALSRRDQRAKALNDDALNDDEAVGSADLSIAAQVTTYVHI